MDKAPWEVDTPVLTSDLAPWEDAPKVAALVTAPSVPDLSQEPYNQDLNTPQQEIAVGKTKTVRDDEASAHVAEMLRAGKPDVDIDAYFQSIGKKPNYDKKVAEQWRQFLADPRHDKSVPAVDVLHQEDNNWFHRLSGSAPAAAVTSAGNAASAGLVGLAAGQDKLAAMQDAHPVSALVGDAVGSGLGAVMAEALATKTAIGAAAPVAGDTAYGALRGGVENPDDPIQGALAGAVLAGTGGAVAHAGIPTRVASEGAVEAPTASPEVAPTDDIVTRLTTALKTAGKASEEQKALYSQERSDRLKKVIGTRQAVGGEAGYRAEMSQLSGELPKADFEGVRGKFEQPEIDTLFDTIRDNKNLSIFDQMNARKGLSKLLDGQVPAPSELDLLGQVYPKDFIKAALSHRSTGAKASDLFAKAVNLPRTMMSTLDFSAPLRQGAFLVGNKNFYRAWPTMFKEFADTFKKNDGLPVNERGSNWQSSGSAILDDIRQRPTYDLMQQAKLAITDSRSTSLTQREEAFLSPWAESIPGYGKLVKASENAYNGFLNKLRADTFDDLVGKSRAAGINLDTDEKALKDIARFVNSATGRGDLGKWAQAGPLLNATFFAPKLIKSRVDLLNPVFYATLSPVVRKEAIKSLLAFGTIATTVAGLAALGGASVETNPLSSDFAKIKVKDTRFDILGGFGQYLTLGARLVANQTKSLKGDTRELGKRYGDKNRLDVLKTFGENKLAPIPSFVADYLRGKNAVGQEFDLKSETAQRFIPLFLQDLKDLHDDPKSAGYAAAIPGLFGVGTQTFDETKKPNEPFREAPTADTSSSSDAPWDSVKTASEGEPWSSVPDADPTPVEANEAVKSILEDQGLIVTDSGIRSHEKQQELYKKYKGVAKPGTSGHEKGNAIDVAPPSDLSPDELKDQLSDAGLTGVRIITKRHGSGPHWHIQWDGLA